MAVLLIYKTWGLANLDFKLTAQSMRDVALCISPSCLIPCLPNRYQKFFHPIILFLSIDSKIPPHQVWTWNMSRWWLIDDHSKRLIYTWMHKCLLCKGICTAQWDLYGTIALRLGLALLVGTILGLNRWHRHKPAGIRTRSLVTIDSATAILLFSDFVQDDA